jgi:hypothetical protein
MNVASLKKFLFDVLKFPAWQQHEQQLKEVKHK